MRIDSLLRPSPRLAGAVLVLACLALPPGALAQARYFPVPSGSHPHDVAPATQAGGPVYFTAQRSGALGILTPGDGRVSMVDLGPGSAPHGVIIGPDGAPWITDGGLNAIVRVDPRTHAISRWPLPAEARDANLNTAAFDGSGRLWFTGQSGFYGRLDSSRGEIRVWKAPRGRGPYGIAATPAGEIWFASLAGNYIAQVDRTTGEAEVIDPPTARQGARRIAADSHGVLWVSYWNAGKLAAYDPAARAWREWSLPRDSHVYAVWVDPADQVWLSEWNANAILRFDPRTGRFDSFASDRRNAGVRQIGARAGEVWAAESGTDRLVRIPVR